MNQFSSAQHCATPAALAELERINYRPQLLLSRHFNGDWAEMEPFDQQQNRWAITNEARILSSYTVEGVKFWVITEADRSVTTILLPRKY